MWHHVKGERCPLICEDRQRLKAGWSQNKRGQMGWREKESDQEMKKEISHGKQDTSYDSGWSKNLCGPHKGSVSLVWKKVFFFHILIPHPALKLIDFPVPLGIKRMLDELPQDLSLLVQFKDSSNNTKKWIKLFSGTKSEIDLYINYIYGITHNTNCTLILVQLVLVSVKLRLHLI